MGKFFKVLIYLSAFFSINANADVAALVQTLNTATAGVNSLGPQISLNIPLQPQLAAAQAALNNPAIIQQITVLEGRVESASRALASRHSSPEVKRAAAKRLAKIGPQLIRLMEARSGLVRAVRQSLRMNLATGLGANPYVTTRGAWLPTTLRIVKNVRGQLGTVTREGARVNQIARGIMAAFNANQLGVQGLFRGPSTSRNMRPAREIPDFVVDPQGNAERP